MKKKIGKMVVALLILPALCFGGTTESDRINGVVDFLLNRGKENYLYIFQQSVRDNKEVRCYFPTIYSYVEDGDLRLLLQSREIWKTSVEADLKNLIARTTAKELGKAINFRQVALDATDRFLEISQYVSVKYGDKEYPITVVQKEPKELKNLINGFYEGAVDVEEALLRIGEKLKIEDTFCSVPTIALSDITELAVDTKEALKKLKKWKEHVDKNKDQLVLNVEKINNDCKRAPGKAYCSAKDKLLSASLPESIADMSAKVETLVQTADVLDLYAKNISQANGNTAKTLIAVKFLEERKIFDEKVLGRFKRHILFFAELSETSSADQTTEILEAYTMPPVSFAVKREKYNNHILLSSYIGYGYGKVLNAGTFGEDNGRGIYAPVGLEFSWGLGNGGSFSFMVAPLDVGYPLNLKLNGTKEDVDLSEIVAPSAIISYGIPKYPLSIGGAYQRSRNSAGAGMAEERVILFIAFDMPLWTFY